MKKILIAGAFTFFNAVIHAQTASFDIVTFIAPKDWQRVDSNGIVMFHQYKTINDQTSFCQILLFPSRAATNNALKNFQVEWANRVSQPTGTKKEPTMETKRSDDGWTAVTGYTNITHQDITYTCMLVVASGHGKIMSVLVNLAGQDYTKEVNSFFESMTLKGDNNPSIAPIMADQDVTGTGLMSDYRFEIPAGWTNTTYPDGIVLSSPGSNTGERCSITIWPMRNAGTNLQQDAIGVFADIFKAYRITTSSTTASMSKGFSTQGWEYFIVKNPITLRGNGYATLFGFAFVARLGNRLAVISGMSKDPLVSSCFGLQLQDVWPKFFYSLQFNNWNAQGQQNEFYQRLAGVWMSVTGSAGDRFAFASNGRYAGTSAAQKYYRLSSTEILRVTDAYFGDGGYSITGSQIILTPDKIPGDTEKGLIRITSESRDSGRTWAEKLYFLRKSRIDGSEYEVCYDRQTN